MAKQRVKILILRFSSIGDIVLTSPVVRNLKKSLPNVELHYLTKSTFKGLLVHNPHIDKLWHFDTNFDEVSTALVQENFDFVVDLHKNLRTLKLKRKLNVKSLSFNKLNVKKLLLTKFKLDLMPAMHIIDRYLESVVSLGVNNDGEGLDYYVNPKSQGAFLELTKELPEKYVVIVMGAAHFTKVPPVEKYKEIVEVVNLPIVLIGGGKDQSTAEAISSRADIFNYCGKTSLDVSALLIKNSALVITPDTGMMHVAAAYKRPVISLWGNTVPEFGMTPYYGDKKVPSLIVEVKNLSCRPCSKIGYDFCPKKHFNCMKQLDVQKIEQWIISRF